MHQWIWPRWKTAPCSEWQAMMQRTPTKPPWLARATSQMLLPDLVCQDGAPGSSRGAAIRGAGVRQIGREATKAVEEGHRNCIASISSQSSRLGRAQATLAFGDEVLDRQN